MSTDVSAVSAVIMAGGMGHRMHPFTGAMPKALLPIGSSIMLDILVAQIRRAGVQDVVVSLGHRASVIRAYCGGHPTLQKHVRFIEESSPLGTAGALSLLSPAPSTVVAVNCDVLSDLCFDQLLRQHHSRRADVTVVGARHRHRLAFGLLEKAESDKLLAWRERVETESLIAAGAYVLSRRAISLLQPGERVDMPTLVERVMAAGGCAYVHTHEGAWFDVGTIESYDRAVAAFEASPATFGIEPQA